MSTAKMLPWLARTAGMRIDRAAQLWQSASAYARRVTGKTTGLRFIGSANGQMALLVEQEVLAANPVEHTPWLAILAHISVAPLIVTNTAAHIYAEVRYAFRCMRAITHCAPACVGLRPCCT